MNAMLNELDFQQADEQVMVLAAIVAANLRAAISRNQKASLVVSGGSTPKPMFAALSQMPLAWDKVTILLADERWVAEDHPDSNTRMVRQTLLQNEATAANFVPLWNDAASLTLGVEKTNARLAAITDAFDLVILGMGDDGHTASLFPCAPPEQLQAGLTLDHTIHCAPMQPAKAPHERITLTLGRLLNSRRIIVHLLGRNKKTVLQKALQAADAKTMPINSVLQQQQVPVDIYWADKG